MLEYHSKMDGAILTFLSTGAAAAPLAEGVANMLAPSEEQAKSAEQIPPSNRLHSQLWPLEALAYPRGSRGVQMP